MLGKVGVSAPGVPPPARPSCAGRRENVCASEMMLVNPNHYCEESSLN